jgi:ribosomal protein S18 acetylase RimI-like enzyme
MAPTIRLYHRPSGRVVDEIVGIASLLAGEWFTANVPGDTRRDLLFQDAFCLYETGQLRSFLVFTGWDGGLHITLMGTHPGCRRQGYGSRLMERFLQHAQEMGFDRVVALTVPPDVKPAYQATIAFYTKHGFVETRRYRELWEQGAVELVKRF